LTFYTSALQLGSNTSAPLCQRSVSGWIEQVAFSSACLSRARELIDETYGITRRKHGNRCLLYTTLTCLDSCAFCNDNSEQFGRLRTMESTTEAPLEESVRYVIRDKPSK
jgi:L-lysine 2,3-aminomutase